MRIRRRAKVRQLKKYGSMAIWLGAVTIAFPSLAATPALSGEALFRQRCQICHSVAATPSAGVGPNLKAVVGRAAAASSFNYSSALKKSKLVWTPANLDQYLSGPTKMVPGTRMVIALADKTQRAAVIKYLSSAR
jgi:cytochrome c